MHAVKKKTVVLFIFTVETNIPDEFSPFIHKKQRDDVKHICVLERHDREDLFT